MRRAKPDDMLTLELDPENKLRIQLKGNNLRTFNLPIIELDEKEQKIPDLKFPVAIHLPSEVLNEAVEDVDVVGESVTFMAEAKKFTINAEGDLSQAKIEMKEDGNIKIKVDESRLRPIDADLQIPDTTKFRKHTGWKPEISFGKTMKDILNFWRQKINSGHFYLTR